jgi:hypothetical protein
MRGFVGLSLVGFLGGLGCATGGSGQVQGGNGAAARDARLETMTFGGGDGTSCAQAVVVHARNEMEGVGAEYQWLAITYPGYARQQQALTTCGDKKADVLTIRTADGRTVDVTFDISEYFGHF